MKSCVFNDRGFAQRIKTVQANNVIDIKVMNEDQLFARFKHSITDVAQHSKPFKVTDLLTYAMCLPILMAWWN